MAFMRVESGRSRASSSVVEQGTFNPRVEGSIPSWLTSSAPGIGYTVPDFSATVLRVSVSSFGAVRIA